MLRHHAFLPAVLIASLAVGFARADQLSTLTDAEAAAVLKTVRPAKGEDAYAQVPWLTSLWEARKTAAAKGKPILLWEMDGHPLGCG